ncbi:nuclear transport factor 2 family protein [Mycolicibacterium grossiae]|uniref:Polyketide cyclase n=1 Tax=Mycolicibacterium grossiae TaxID=1552759 RepID=A0A1E8Q091_9MYCO|nr:nuclear transport factor 2 family protein [Mycolicibacterium grossiae]OFJ51294.1 polyketide cyclase [Mycolicibacterium grossiae]QEM47440.1 nuclear transport factor 2 family protein [Mycolicibacterium grossiae]
MAHVDPDTAEIGDVLTRYATGIDTKDWALFRTCWADEIDVDYAEVGTFTDPDAFTDLMAQLHGSMGPTYHRLSNIVVDVVGDRATARCYVHAVLLLTPDDRDNWIDVVGHYEDVLVRTADGWRISARSTHMARMLTGGARADAATSAGIDGA